MRSSEEAIVYTGECVEQKDIKLEKCQSQITSGFAHEVWTLGLKVIGDF